MVDMKKIGYLISILALVVISIPILNINNDKISAATNYAAGKKVYVGNDTYTVIDSGTMTLLKNTATDAGEVTWNDAVASLDTLADNYGELGSKAVSGKFTLPKTSDLTKVISSDQTSLVNIDAISTDWWLGDESVDNRSKFVGADTNSLVTDVSIVKNVVDTNNYVCLNDQTVTEQGIKPTRTEADKVTNDVFQLEAPQIDIRSNYFGAFSYNQKNCQGAGAGSSEGNMRNLIRVIADTAALLKDDSLNLSGLMEIYNGYSEPYIYKFLTESGMNEYVKEFVKNPESGYNREFTFSVSRNVCYNLPDDILNNPDYPSDYKSFKVHTLPSQPIKVRIVNVTNSKSVTCGGHSQTAGTSSVRPLLTLDKSKIAYSSNAKPT
ncbi:hypothetical protein D5266_09610, partial [bacterium c-19]|nr:hypothetical protein [bacterium c-19]